jgi:hypothetical protein
MRSQMSQVDTHCAIWWNGVGRRIERTDMADDLTVLIGHGSEHGGRRSDSGRDGKKIGGPDR